MVLTLVLGGAAVCSDGYRGQVQAVVLDPAAGTVTHLVVEPEGRSGLARLVPLDLVDTARDAVRLRCTEAEFRDLEAADCVDSVAAIARPEMGSVLLNATGEIFRTDGTLTVVNLKSCAPNSADTVPQNESSYRPGSKTFRCVRKWILTVRSDLWRANVLYGAFDLGRVTFQAVQRNRLHRSDMELFRESAYAHGPAPVQSAEGSQTP